ncbi:MAG: helix-turn-helix domain-containing protein [Planctomycetota bacterium]
MANQLSMAEVKSIETLHAFGHSNRQIAKLLGNHRETVDGYVNRLKAQNQPFAE